MKKLMNFNIPLDIADWLQRERERTGLSMTAVLIMLIREKMSEQ